MYNEEELYAALRVLHNVCAQHKTCTTCPFRTEDGDYAECRVCCADASPVDWEIPDANVDDTEPRLDF